MSTTFNNLDFGLTFARAVSKDLWPLHHLISTAKRLDTGLFLDEL